MSTEMMLITAMSQLKTENEQLTSLIKNIEIQRDTLEINVVGGLKVARYEMKNRQNNANKH